VTANADVVEGTTVPSGTEVPHGTGRPDGTHGADGTQLTSDTQLASDTPVPAYGVGAGPATAELPTQLVARTRAMATDVTVRMVLRGRAIADPRAVRASQAALNAAVAVFGEVETECTRFDPASALMRANANPGGWVRVPPTCYLSLSEAWTAYRRTGGLFDPRVLRELVTLGYDRSLPFAAGEVVLDGASQDATPQRASWAPEFRPLTHQVHLQEPVDLGGIGKGLAVRWARDRLWTACDDFLIEAGGDCYCAGLEPGGGPWGIGVEDPLGGDSVAVLSLTDRACTTSSIRLRRWQVGGRTVHHLIDPRTGAPGGAGLLAVTVVDDDPATAEVSSKTLFLAGADGIADACTATGAAALWVAEDGSLGTSAAMEPYVAWRSR
jgi:FAD:protein FMN transferase